MEGRRDGLGCEVEVKMHLDGDELSFCVCTTTWIQWKRIYCVSIIMNVRQYVFISQEHDFKWEVVLCLTTTVKTQTNMTPRSRRWSLFFPSLVMIFVLYLLRSPTTYPPGTGTSHCKPKLYFRHLPRINYRYPKPNTTTHSTPR